MLKTQPTNKEYKVEHLFSFVVELVSKLKIAYLISYLSIKYISEIFDRFQTSFYKSFK